MSGLRSLLLIAGVDTIGVSRLPAVFAAAGFEVCLLGPKRLAARRSRFVRQFIASEPGSAGALARARTYLAESPHPFDATLIADEPTLLMALDAVTSDPASFAWMKDWSPVPLTPQSLARVLSKTQFLIDCRDRGIPVPAFEVCAPGNVLGVADRMGYPVFVKAARGLSGSGLRYATSRPHLEPQLVLFQNEPLLAVQEEISGQVGSISVLYDRGQPTCWFSYLSRETWPNRFAAACTIEVFSNPRIRTLVEQVGELTAFDGPCAIDFMHDPASGRICLLEFNPRPGPGYYLGWHAGADFVAALRDWHIRPVRREPSATSGKIVRMFPQASYRSIDKRRIAQLAQTFRDASWNDPGLMLAHLRRLTTHYLRAALRAQ